MAEDNLFDGTPTSGGDNPPQGGTQAPQIPTELQELVGEGKKYGSLDDAMKSIPHAQEHISRLEQELHALRDDLKSRQTTEEILNSFAEKARGNAEPRRSDPTPNAPIDPNAVATLVLKALDTKQREETQTANEATAIKAFREMHGDAAKEALDEKAKELGVNTDFLKSVARSSPSAFLKLVGVQPKSSSNTKQGDVDTERFINNQAPSNPQPSKIMFGASTQDMVNAWKQAGANVNQRKE
ncbi:MAG: hypothetical protein ACWGQW_19075 [bacterium]